MDVILSRWSVGTGQSSGRSHHDPENLQGRDHKVHVTAVSARVRLRGATQSPAAAGGGCFFGGPFGGSVCSGPLGLSQATLPKMQGSQSHPGMSVLFLSL